MEKMEKWYDKEEDILGIRIKDWKYWKSLELNDGMIVMDIDKGGNILGIEIFEASKTFAKAKIVLANAEKIEA